MILHAPSVWELRTGRFNVKNWLWETDALITNVSVLGNSTNRDVIVHLDAQPTNAPGAEVHPRALINEMVHGVGTIQFGWTIDQNTPDQFTAFIIISKL